MAPQEQDAVPSPTSASVATSDSVNRYHSKRSRSSTNAPRSPESNTTHVSPARSSANQPARPGLQSRTSSAPSIPRLHDIGRGSTYGESATRSHHDHQESLASITSDPFFHNYESLGTASLSRELRLALNIGFADDGDGETDSLRYTEMPSAIGSSDSAVRAMGCS
jgi:hypothetical protein